MCEKSTLSTITTLSLLTNISVSVHSVEHHSLHTHTGAPISTESWIAAALKPTLSVVTGGSINTLYLSSIIGVVAVLLPITEVCVCYTLINIYKQ